MSKSFSKTIVMLFFLFIFVGSIYTVNAQVKNQFDIFYNEYWKMKIEGDNLDKTTYEFYVNKIRQNNSVLDGTGVLVDKTLGLSDAQKNVIKDSLSKMKYLNEKYLEDMKDAKDKGDSYKLPTIYSEIVRHESKIDIFVRYQGARFLINKLSSEGGEVKQTITILQQEGADRTKISILNNYYDDLQFYKKDFEDSISTGVSNDGLILDYDKANNFNKNVYNKLSAIISYLEEIYSEQGK